MRVRGWEGGNICEYHFLKVQASKQAKEATEIKKQKNEIKKQKKQGGWGVLQPAVAACGVYACVVLPG